MFWQSLAELGSPKVSDVAYLTVVSFKKTPVKHCNAANIDLIIHCQQFVDHAKWADANAHKLEALGLMENGQIKSSKFLMELGTLYCSEPHFRDSLLMGLIQYIMTRYKGGGRYCTL
jgi:hypothetical protein